jgi:preprotein translocase subunit SecA
MKGFLRQGIGRLQGTSVRFDLSDYAAATAAIADLEKELRELSDQEIQRRGQDLHDRARAGADRNVLRIPSFALTRAWLSTPDMSWRCRLVKERRWRP